MRDRRLIALSRSFRSRPTSPEKELWKKLRNRRLGGLKFRRQVPIGRYVADFVCEEAKVVVELDGEGHERTVERDGRRKTEIEGEGYLVLRFGSEILVDDADEIPALILQACLKRLRPS